MNFSHFDNHSKTLTFKKFKCLLYKYHPRFSKICKNNVHLNQFLVLLYDFVPNSKQLLSIEKLLKNAKVSQSGMGKNPTNALYKETTKP